MTQQEHQLVQALQAEYRRAARDGMPKTQTVPGAELALAGYLAGITQAIKIAKGVA